MTRRIGLATTIAAVAILTLGLLALAPAAAQAGSVSVSITGNTLQVVGDNADNDIAVTDETDPGCPGGSPCYSVASLFSVLIPSPPCIVSDVPLPYGGVRHRALCPASGLTEVAIFGQGGSDGLVAESNVLGADIQGGADGDSIDGSNQADTLYGNSGKDEILGRNGNDSLLGGPGNDDLTGGPGNDLLKGQAGNDGMNGSRKGHDRCIGGPGRDTPRQCEQVKSVP
jgi:Ca2+-binding RTX toxin-like protein